MAWKPDYSTVGRTKDFLRIADDVDDVILGVAITAASRAIDRASGRQFGLAASAHDRFYTAVWDRKKCKWVVEIDDLMTQVGLTLAYDSAGDGTYATSITSGYAFYPLNAAADGRPWERIWIDPNVIGRRSQIEPAVRMHAQPGWTAIPVSIEQATWLQVSRWHARRDAPFGVAGSPESGSEMRLLERLDPDVATSIRDYRRVWGVV